MANTPTPNTGTSQPIILPVLDESVISALNDSTTDLSLQPSLPDDHTSTLLKRIEVLEKDNGRLRIAWNENVCAKRLFMLRAYNAQLQSQIEYQASIIAAHRQTLDQVSESIYTIAQLTSPTTSPIAYSNVTTRVHECATQLILRLSPPRSSSINAHPILEESDDLSLNKSHQPAITQFQSPWLHSPLDANLSSLDNKLRHSYTFNNDFVIPVPGSQAWWDALTLLDGLLPSLLGSLVQFKTCLSMFSGIHPDIRGSEQGTDVLRHVSKAVNLVTQVIIASGPCSKIPLSIIAHPPSLLLDEVNDTIPDLKDWIKSIFSNDGRAYNLSPKFRDQIELRLGEMWLYWHRKLAAFSLENKHMAKAIAYIQSVAEKQNLHVAQLISDLENDRQSLKQMVNKHFRAPVHDLLIGLSDLKSNYSNQGALLLVKQCDSVLTQMSGNLNQLKV